MKTEQFVANFFLPGEPYGLELRGISEAFSPKVLSHFISAGDPLPSLSPDRNWYVTVCAHRRPEKSTSSKTSVGAMALWADLDHLTPKEAGRRLDASGLPTPSIAINSGNGVHFYWLLKEPVLFTAKDVAKQFVEQLKRIARLLGGDLKVADIARIMRLPGTFNVKDPANPKLCEILSTARERLDYATFSDALEPLNVLRAQWVEGRRHALSLAVPGWFRRNGFGTKESCTKLLEALYGETLDSATADAVERAFSLPENEVAFRPHFEAAFPSTPWIVDFFMVEFRAAKERVVEKRAEGARAEVSTEVPPSASRVEAQLADDQFATWTPAAIAVETRTVDRKGNASSHERKVIVGGVKPVEALRIDDDFAFAYELGGERVVGNLDDVLRVLGQRGLVVSQRNAKDVLSALTTRMTGTPRRVHATIGVYDEGGSLRLCMDAMPAKDEQVKTFERTKSHLGIEAERGDVEDYLRLLAYWHPYEILPAAGLALVAPLTPILRARQVMVPHFYGWSAESDLGKSAVGLAWADRLFGTEGISGRSIDTPYRLAAHLDHACLPLVVDEAEGLRPTLFPTLKESAERWLVDKRGRSSLDMIRYNSRAVLLLNGQTPGRLKPTERKRFIMPRYDPAQRGARRLRGPQLDRLLNRLRPIGYDLVRRFLGEATTADDLMARLAQVETQIREARASWASPKRPQAYATAYLGLLVLDHAAKEFETPWRAPSIAEFVKTVVDPIETDMWGETASQLSAFILWLNVWRHDRGSVYKGTLFWDVGHDDEKAFGMGGTLVAKEVLNEFNRQCADDEHIDTLKELGRQVCSTYGIDDALMFDAKGLPKPRATGGLKGVGKQRMVFVTATTEPIEDEEVGGGEGASVGTPHMNPDPLPRSRVPEKNAARSAETSPSGIDEKPGPERGNAERGPTTHHDANAGGEGVSP